VFGEVKIFNITVMHFDAIILKINKLLYVCSGLRCRDKILQNGPNIILKPTDA